VVRSVESIHNIGEGVMIIAAMMSACILRGDCLWAPRYGMRNNGYTCIVGEFPCSGFLRDVVMRREDVEIRQW
jgi:hypothetical protein